MRLVRILGTLHEAVSVSHLKNPLFNVYAKAVTAAVNSLDQQIESVSDKAKDSYRQTGSPRVLIQTLKPILIQELDTSLSSALRRVVKRELKETIQVEFIQLGSALGTATGLTLSLSTEFLKKLAVACFNDILDSTGDDSDPVSGFFDTISRYETSNAQTPAIGELLHTMVNTTVHELVHIVQHARQFAKGRTGLEYRSYLMPDKSKFHDSIRKMSDVGPSTDDYKIYRASPQEIPAFAHEAALAFIRDANIDKLASEEESPVRLINQLPNMLQGYTDIMFDKPETPSEYKIFKRFGKLLYQEVVRYIEQLVK